VVVVELGVDELMPELLLPVEPEPVEPEPLAPIELVPPLPLVEPEPLADVSVLLLPVLPVEPLPPAVLLEPEPEPPLVDGLVLELVEPVPLPLAPVVPALSRLLHAPRDRAATTASTAAAVWVIDVFIRNSLRGC
jgi:hypothetical protein